MEFVLKFYTASIYIQPESKYETKGATKNEMQIKMDQHLQ